LPTKITNPIEKASELSTINKKLVGIRRN